MATSPTMFKQRGGTVLWRCSSTHSTILIFVTVYYRGSLMQDDSKHSESSDLTNIWEPTVKATTKSNSTVSCGSDQANFKAFIHCVRVVEAAMFDVTGLLILTVTLSTGDELNRKGRSNMIWYGCPTLSIAIRSCLRDPELRIISYPSNLRMS